MQTLNVKTASHPGRKILICAGKLPREDAEDDFEPEFVAGPLECLSLATRRTYDNIIVDFISRDAVRRELLFSLCRALKNNPLTSGIEVIAIVAGQDRYGLEILKGVGIHHVFVLPADISSWNSRSHDLHMIMHNLRNTRDILLESCPLIAYNVTDRSTTCGAHANRLVLSSRRLAALCCSKKHLACEFFCNSPAAKMEEYAAQADSYTESVCVTFKSRKEGPDDETQE